MWRVLLISLASAGIVQGEWLQTRSGPFEVYSDGNSKLARETLANFEQFRYALGYTLSKPDLQADPRIRILLFKNAKELQGAGSPASLIRGRDRYVIPTSADSAPPQQVFADCTRLFLERNVDRLPRAFELGLEKFFSTIEVHGTHVTWGAPPANRDRDWARMHLLIANPDNYSKTRVLLFNLQKGVDEDAAYRNALGQSRSDFEAEVDRYWKAGSFPTSAAPSRPLSPERDLHTTALEPEFVSLALADLLNDRSRERYEAMLREKSHVAESEEGLALLALSRKNEAAARDHLARATELGSRNVTVLIAYSRLETDQAKAQEALKRAVEADPNSAEAHFIMGEKASDLKTRTAEWTAATKLAPRNGDYWAALAKLYLDQKRFGEAAKAWRSAEQAASTESERERMRTARLAIEQQRLDYEEAERRRIAEEKERDIRRLKAQAIADLRAAEAKANGAPRSGEAAGKAVEWWDGPKPEGHIEGVLKQVDCIGKQARVVVESEGRKSTRLLVRDPSQIVFSGAGEATLSCGVQKPRRAKIEYYPKINSRLGTSGEVATIEFEQ